MMAKRGVQVDRDLHRCRQQIVLCISEGQYLAECRAWKIKNPDHWLDNSDCHAMVHHWKRGRDIVAVVCIGNISNLGEPHITGVIVHEVVHIWKRHVKEIGEDKPSSEFEAYGIQFISVRLLEAYAKTKKRKGK